MMIAGYIAGTFGLVAGPWVGIAVFAVLSAGINFASFFFSHKFVLWSYRAKIVTAAEEPRLHAVVGKIAQKAGLPMPKVAVIPMDTPNAFATGRSPKHAVVAATRGILAMLNDDELEGVMAHEMGHVRNRDMLIMSVAATVAGAITFAARMLFWNSLFGGNRRNQNPLMLVVGIAFMVLAPLAALVIQLAISRRREFEADKSGAELSGKPLALASALRKMEALAQQRPLSEKQVSSATASLFIVNPFSGGGMSAMFRTHPRTQDRIARLEAMAGAKLV
jgi:heat shock protein HtpX